MEQWHELRSNTTCYNAPMHSHAFTCTHMHYATQVSLLSLSSVRRNSHTATAFSVSVSVFVSVWASVDVVSSSWRPGPADMQQPADR